MQRSLAEKESLLQEVHHRVKNNLQVMSSLLRMEGRRTSSAEARAMIGEMQGRILSMALLHETLYRSRDFAEVDLSAYLGRLAEQLLRAAAPGGTIKLALNLAPAQIGLDQAIPCGLLANELMSNSLKHAFPGGRRGTLTIDLAREGEGGALVLRVSDDGVGLSPDAEARSQRSLGLTLVHDLTRQLQGTLEIDGARGVSSTLRFTPSITRTKG
ncbi:MAG: sensor histidine kinase [Byssovorax sp.]